MTNKIALITGAEAGAGISPDRLPGRHMRNCTQRRASTYPLDQPLLKGRGNADGKNSTLEKWRSLDDC